MSRERAGKKRGPYKGNTEYEVETYRRRRLKSNRNAHGAIRDYKRHIQENVLIDPDTECWVWQRSKNNLGYGFISYHGKGNQLVHRVSYQEFIGPIPDGLNVLHHCDNPPCANPDHLFTGTQKDNAADMVAKGRDLRSLLVKDPARREALSASQRKHQTGRRVFNNGIKVIKIEPGVEPPVGFVPGFLPGSNIGNKPGFKWSAHQLARQRLATINNTFGQNRYWVTDGQRNHTIPNGQEPPAGFRRGITRKPKAK
jgi:hypothetical protein